MNTVNDPLMKPIIAQLESGHDLSAQQVNSCAEFLLDEAADIGEKAQLLKALSGKAPLSITQGHAKPSAFLV